ncbi:sugar transferase [bacterium]|nr:sugar transferase [bacterium]
MKKWNLFDSPLIKVICELLIFFLASLLGYYLRFKWGIFPVKLGIPSVLPYIWLFSIQALIWALLFERSRLYRRHYFISVIDEWYSVFIALFSGSVIALAFTFFFREFTFSRTLIAGNLLLVFVITAFFRFAMNRLAEHFYKRGYGSEDALIVADKDSELLTKRLSHLKRLGYHVKDVISALDSGNFGDSATIFWDLDTFSVKQLTKLIEDGTISPMTHIIYFSDIFSGISPHLELFNVAGLPALRMKKREISGVGAFFKRLFDILFSLIAMILLLIPWLMIGFLVKFSSKGPVFYLQERITKKGRIFKIIKFRTMKIDAEDTSGPVWAKKDDPRRTSIGEFLRKTSLDETPQFINVFIGDMSVVGPRPEREFFVEKFKKEIPWYSMRHNVKSGITGWSQINGWRGNTSIRERTLFDLYYINNWSLVFDIKIIMRTVFEFFFQKEAY